MRELEAQSGTTRREVETEKVGKKEGELRHHKSKASEA
jgi:hypothetical protein